MAQQIINVGAAPNDGQGDPIRTAFQKTNSNFTELYARAQTLPPVSLTGQDGDVPGMYAYDSTYFYYCFDAWDGSSIIWAQVTQVGNISTNQIVSGNSNVIITGAGGTVAVGVGGTANVAVFSTTGVSVTGNVAASGYVLGNGSQLTGLPQTFANANVQAYAEAGWSGNIVPSANAQYNLGSASNQWKSLYVSNTTIYLGNVALGIGAGNTLTVAGQPVLSNNSNANITTTGNVAVGAILTDGYYFANGSPFVAVSEYGNANVAEYLPDYTGNVNNLNFGLGNIIQGPGAYVKLQGPDDTRLASDTGNVEIWAGATDRVWKFDVNGNLTLPNVANIAINYANGDPYGGGGGAGLPLANGTSNFNIATANGNATVTVGNVGNTVTYTFGTDGVLSGDVAFFNDVIVNNAGTNKILYTDDDRKIYDTGFAYDAANTAISGSGNITANYFIGDGSELTNLPSGGGIIFEYDIANFTANATPAVGTMQFTDVEGQVVLPDEGTRLFISTQDGTGQQTGSIWRGLANNSERATLTLQLNGQQQSFRVANMGVYTQPQTYRGYRAGVNQIWGDDASINQFIITNATAAVFYNENFDLESDVFHATNLGDASVAYMVNVYGSTQEYPLNPGQLWNFFTGFVDQVIYQGTDTETQVAADIKTAFYTNFSNFRNNINADAYYRDFDFADGTTYYNNAGVNGGSGIDGTLRVRLNATNTYTILGVGAAGTGYQQGNELTVPGTSLGGVSPDNDLVVDVATVDGSGGITAVSIISGTAAYPWPSNNINDGGDDQYDNANYINTNLAQEINYGSGNVTAGDAEFGVGSEYVTMYDNSIFCFVATGVDITDLFYSGNLGSDGDGFLHWTGLVDPGVGDPEFVYAYMDCAIGTGTLEPQEGLTYQVALDSDGVNLDQFYSYLNDNTNDWYFGADRDWRLESKQDLFVQSYDQLILRTVIDSDASGVSGPTLTMRTAQGSQASAQYNTSAGNGGFLEIFAGDGGSADGVPSLGGQGGSIEILAGESFGTDQTGGTVQIESGSSPNGTGGNVTIQAAGGTVGNGHIVLRTTAYGVEDRSWSLNSKGQTVFPILNVARGDTSGGNISGYVLNIGDGNNEAIITTPDGNPVGGQNSQRLVINPGKGQDGTGGEGGDIYLWAGRGGDTDGSGGDIKIRGGQGMGNGTGGYMRFEAGDSQGTGAAGYVEITGGQTTGGYPGYISLQGGFNNDGAGGSIDLLGGQGTGTGGDINLTGGPSSAGLGDYGNVRVASGASLWIFDNAGNLNLPGNTFAVNYANGSPVSLASASTGNVTFDDITIQGVGDEYGGGGLNLSPDANLTANLMYFRVRGGDDPTHLHFDTGNNNQYNQYFGDDNKYLKLEAGLAGNIKIGTYQDGGIGAMSWTFDSNGILTLAQGNSTIQSVANSSLDPLNPGVSTMVLTPDPNYSLQALVLDPTAPGHIHLRAPSFFGNIDDPSANLFLGGETSSFEVGYGANANVFIHSNNNTWTFDNTGNVVFPANNLVLNGNASLYGTATAVVAAANNQPLFASVSGSAAGGIIWAENPADFANANTAAVYVNAPFNASGVTVVAGVPSGSQYAWNFDVDGMLTLPSGEGRIRSIDDTVNLISYNTTTGNANSVYLGSGGGLGFFDQEIGGNWLEIFRSGTEPQIRTTVGNINVQTANGVTAYNWVFSDTGNLVLAGDLVGSGASPAPSISGFGTINSLTQVTTPTTFASLTAVSGARAFVSDGNLVAAGNFGANVSGGGSNTVPVWSDGVNWYIG